MRSTKRAIDRFGATLPFLGGWGARTCVGVLGGPQALHGSWLLACPSLSASVVLIFLVASAVLFRTPSAWAACYDEEAIFVYEPSMSQAYGMALSTTSSN